MFRFTKIGVTIGPASASHETLREMVKAGMNFARLNFSHGTYDSHAAAIKLARELEQETGEAIAIMADLQGPKIRVGVMPDAGVAVSEKQIITFNSSLIACRDEQIPIEYPNLEKYLKAGEKMLIDDGRIEVKIIKMSGAKIFAEVTSAGTILSRKGINLPQSILPIPVVSAKDKQDLRFAIKAGADAVALSFVSRAKDISDIRALIKKIALEEKITLDEPIQIIAKIERHEAVENLAEILKAADGLMVARGDLGLEMPEEDVPLAQKKIIDLANAAAKPVIVATQMLDSMRENKRPTRAEVSDVANAVIDHADALLLTNETAVGKFPVESVKTMAEIIVATEKSRYDDTALPPVKRGTTTEVAVTELSRVLAEEVHAKLILAASLTGETGRLISHVRPELPIVVATSTARVCRQLNLSWGIKPFILLPCKTIEELIARSLAYLAQHKLAKKGDKMIIVAGEPVGQAGNVNLVEVREIK